MNILVLVKPVPDPEQEKNIRIDAESGRIVLGDMMLSLERCAAQGEEYGHGFERELRYLCVHSVLHLLGYDHLDEGPMKAQMRQREEEILQKIDLSR